MDQSGRRARRPDVVGASELAEMGVCERRVLLAHRYGPRRTSTQQRAMQRGLRAHERFHRDGLAAKEGPSRRHTPAVFASLGRWFVGFCLRIVLAVLRSLAGYGRRARDPGEGG
jgi:hypothetical protein